MIKGAKAIVSATEEERRALAEPIIDGGYGGEVYAEGGEYGACVDDCRGFKK